MKLVRQPPDQLEDLRLDRHVERCRGLVGEDQLRVAGQCDGDHHTLAHAAGELVRVVVETVLRAGDAHLAQQLSHPVPRGRTG